MAFLWKSTSQIPFILAVEEIPPEIHEPNSIHPQENLATNSPRRENTAQQLLSDDQLHMFFVLQEAVEES
jgi:hypothetical protein